MTVLAATAWCSNADLILDCVALGYLREEWLTLDPTYGNGNWWRFWRPSSLITHNRDEDGSDFRELPHAAHTFDAVAYDPPYVSVGGRQTTGIASMHRAYGMNDAPTSPALLQELINDGLNEMHRIVKPGGMLLVKCQDYISSGKYWAGTHFTLAHALHLGFELADRLEHVVAAPRPQPPGRRQVHARRNLSTMFVLRA